MNAPRTVLGDPVRADYDTVLAHEHLRIDIRCWLDETHEPSRALRDAPVDERTVQAVRTNPFACLDNLVLDDPALIAEELSRVRDTGRTLLVEVTPENVGRDLVLLAEISRSAGVDVVYGCGRYIAESRPLDDETLAPAAYRDEILAQLEPPAGGPRPAVIGEIGTGDPILPVELASLGGYGDRLVHAHDVCTKTQLHRHGGAGYDHLPRNVARRLRAAGLSEPELRRQLAGNALALICSADEPRPHRSL